MSEKLWFKPTKEITISIYFPSKSIILQIIFSKPILFVMY